MKIKLNDVIIPKPAVGRVVDVKKDKIILERTDSSGVTRTYEYTKQHAETRNTTLEELIRKYFYLVEPNELKEVE